MPVSTNEFADKLQRVADFYGEFWLSPKIAVLLHDASNIARSFSVIVDKNDELKAENAKLRKLCRDLQFCRGNDCLRCSHGRFCDLRLDERCDELGVEVDE